MVVSEGYCLLILLQFGVPPSCSRPYTDTDKEIRLYIKETMQNKVLCYPPNFEVSINVTTVTNKEFSLQVIHFQRKSYFFFFLLSFHLTMFNSRITTVSAIMTYFGHHQVVLTQSLSTLSALPPSLPNIYN